MLEEVTSSTGTFLLGSQILTVNTPCASWEGRVLCWKSFMESGKRKKNGDNKAGTARIAWGGIRKTDLEITGQEDAASWEDGALGRIRTRLQGRRDHRQSPRGHREHCLA